MANVYGYTGSDEFQVKDEQAFAQWCKHYDIDYDTWKGKVEIWSEDDGGSGYYRWPKPHECDEDCCTGGDDCECDKDHCDGPQESVGDIAKWFLDELAQHLVNGGVAILFQFAGEKASFGGADAVAVSWDGRCVALDLRDATRRLAEETFAPKPSKYELADRLAYSIMALQSETTLFMAERGLLIVPKYERFCKQLRRDLTAHITAVQEHLERLRQHQIAGILKR